MRNIADGPIAAKAKAGWLKRRKVYRLLDLPDKEAASKLGKVRPYVLQVLIDAIERGHPQSAKAAYLIGKIAEEGMDCREAIAPLYGLLQNGCDLEKGNAAIALARMWTKESISMLVAGLSDKDNITRRSAAMGLGLAMADDPAVVNALKKAADGDWDPEVRRLAQNSLRQIAELQG